MLVYEKFLLPSKWKGRVTSIKDNEKERNNVTYLEDSVNISNDKVEFDCMFRKLTNIKKGPTEMMNSIITEK